MKIISAVSLILGCFMGAGFVSGREVACYFSKFGSISYFSCVVCGILFFLLTMFFFSVSNKAHNTSEFISIYFMRSGVVVEWLFAICILILTGSMIAGTSALAESLEYNQAIIVAITLVLTYFVVSNNVQGLTKVNVVLVPILILVLILTMQSGNSVLVENNQILTSLVSGSGYVFINIVSLGLLILEIGHKFSKKEKVLISLICTIIITLLLLGVNHSIITNNLVDNLMPNLFLSSRNIVLYVVMQISIYLGLFTTLISNVFLLSNFVNKYIKSKTFSIIASLILGLLISICGFDNLVGYIYIFIGGVGVFVVLIGLKNNKKTNISPTLS